MFLLHSCFLGFYVAVWNLSWEIQGLQGAGDFFFFFFLSLSLSLFTSLCLSASLYSAVKTPQPPSHGCHSNHLPALTSYVSVRSCMWARVRVRARWGTWHIGKVSAGCLSYHLEAFPLSEAVCVTQNYTHTTTHLCTRTSTHTHTREASCVSDVL